MLKLLEYLVKKITGNNEVKITENEQEGTSVYTVSAPKEVMGLLIGKEGKTIRAIRSLARARAIIEQQKVFIAVQEKS